jgi:phage shock protein A
MAVHYQQENYPMPKTATKQTLNQKIRAASKGLKTLTKDLDKNIKTQARLEAKIVATNAKLEKLNAKAAQA